ncbi:hypothetical protein ACHQM5_001413 [Ranunculus cassubicifolius]
MDLRILFLHLILLSYVLSASAAVDSFGCQRDCGNVSVPYPFGWGDSKACYKDENYIVICNDTSDSSTLFLGENLPLFNINVENATAVIGIDISFQCYNESGQSRSFFQNVTFGTSPFVFSTQNRFMAVGCDTVALMGDNNQVQFTSGCISMCSSNSTDQIDNPVDFKEELLSCSGIGCCQTPVPKNLVTLNVWIGGISNHSSQLETNPCSFAFFGDPTWYRNSANFALTDTPETRKNSLVVLDWAIRGNITCENQDGLICGDNSNCFNSSNGPGYLCSCNEGFKGNPYTQTGCEDINECKNPQNYPCSGHCTNIQGNYTCACSFGMQGDGKFGCSLSTGSKVVIGVGSGILFVIFVLCLYWLHKKKIQQLNHLKNGGLLLDQLSVKNFREAQLEKATDDFDAKNLLGEGGNGWVYKGSLVDMTEIAVKKSKMVDQNQIEQFLNEAEIVSKINHKNVVKLLGLCTESKVPMLVYEYVPNGTLFQHLHAKNSRILDSWRICLRVAAETARALEYMHSLAYPPMIHRDVKSSNILLDGTYTAKVADFGASILVPLDRAIAPTQGQGTMGYLDPEYLQTGELTTMSDVYGFGVVLMELLSKQKPISRGVSGDIISLVKVFTLAVENYQHHEVVKVAEVSDHETEQVQEVANLAIRCVAMPSKRRPTMSEVADILNGMSKEYKSFPVEGGGNDVMGLLDDQDILTTSVHFELEYSDNV